MKSTLEAAVAALTEQEEQLSQRWGELRKQLSLAHPGGFSPFTSRDACVYFALRDPMASLKAARQDLQHILQAYPTEETHVEQPQWIDEVTP